MIDFKSNNINGLNFVINRSNNQAKYYILNFFVNMSSQSTFYFIIKIMPILFKLSYIIFNF